MNELPRVWYIAKNVRTYGDLITKVQSNNSRGTCCACHQYSVATWQLSTRASICRSCCERKSTQTLGPIVKRERRARDWMQYHPDLRDEKGIAWIARMTGCSVEFVRECAEAAKTKETANVRP